MPDIATIARPYAEAVFKTAKEENLNNWLDFLTELENLVLVPEFKNLIRNPKFSKDKQEEILINVINDNLGLEKKNFINLVVKNNRLSLVNEIKKQFQNLKNDFEGIFLAEIYSAFEMSEEDIKDFLTTVEKKFNRKLNFVFKVDKSLIGGVKIVIGDEVLDYSVSHRLRLMQKALLA
tara:strand:+ start:1796 stop:2329 length:534 start_codon:yes stop_codon:yes gene_type:complete